MPTFIGMSMSRQGRRVVLIPARRRIAAGAAYAWAASSRASHCRLQGSRIVPFMMPLLPRRAVGITVARSVEVDAVTHCRAAETFSFQVVDRYDDLRARQLVERFDVSAEIPCRR